MGTGHETNVTACTVSPDGAFFVSAGSDGVLKLWDVSTGGELRTLEGHPGPVLFCAAGHDGRVYSAGPSAGFDAVVKVWDATTGGELLGWDQRDVGDLQGLVLSPGGTYVATLRSYGYADIHEPATGEWLRRIDAGTQAGTTACAVSPDGAFLVVAGGRELHVLDPFTGEALAVFASPQYGPQPFAITPDAASVVFAEADVGWAVGDIASGRTRALGDEEPFAACTVSPDGALIAACRADVEDTWNSVTGSQRTVRSSSLRVRRLDSGALVHDVDLAGEEGLLCAFTPDASLVLVAGATMLRIFDVETGEEIGGLPLDAEPTCMAVHPSRAVVAIGDAVGGFRVLDLGIELGPLVVTAEAGGVSPEVRCPACGAASPVQEADKAAQLACSQCGAALRVTPFELTVRADPVPALAPGAPDEEEQLRFTQAQNRAVFTSGSIEDLTELAQRRGMEVPQAEAPAVTSLNEEIRAVLQEELAEAGADGDGMERGVRMLRATDAAASALREQAAGRLDAAQTGRLDAAAAEGNPLDVIRVLHEELPDLDVLGAVREQARTVFSQPEDPTRLRLAAITQEEADAAGVRDLPPMVMSAVLQGGMGQAWTELLAGLSPRLDDAGRAELERLKNEAELEDVVRFLQGSLPDVDVLEAYRAELRAAYPSAIEQVNEMSANIERMFGEERFAEPEPPKKRSWFRRRRR